MKKIIFILILIQVSFCSQAQKDKIKNIQKENTQMKVFVQPQTMNTNINLAPSIQVFEFPNYQGRVAAFTKNASGKFVFPFPVQHVSIKIPDSLILYLRTCFEFPTENPYFVSQKDIGLETLCGIHTDVKTKLRVTFNGISTAIHNRDCMRFAGKVQLRVVETEQDDATIQAEMRWRVEQAGSRTLTGPFTTPLVNLPTQELTDNSFDIELNSGLIFNNNPVPNLTQQAHYSNHLLDNSSQVFIVGKAALQSGRVKLLVNTNLTSAHKSCDLCDDFSSNVKMLAPGFATIPFNKIYDGGKIVDAAHPYVIIGPYHAHGSRAGFALTASNGTDKDFRVHLKVNQE